MNNVEIRDTAVKCDEAGCDWEQKVAWSSVPEWHLKPCPKCGKGHIVSDGDLILYCALDAAAKCANTKIQQAKETDLVVEMHLDTAPLRTSNVRGQGTRHLVEGTLDPLVRIHY